MSNPFILIARIRVKEGKVEEYLKIAKEADDAVNASEPDMLIHTFDQDPTDHFLKLKLLANENKINELSIGMSDDYEKALEFHPTYIRLGTILFGKRV